MSDATTVLQEILPALKTHRTARRDAGQALLEHVNVTTFSARETAQLMCDVFGWRIRWEGPAKLGGHSIHVGTDGAYVALYTPPSDLKQAAGEGQPNHIGVCVRDLAATETKIRAAGYKPYAHADYEPGHRFYFRDKGGLEIEVVSYD